MSLSVHESRCCCCARHSIQHFRICKICWFFFLERILQVITQKNVTVRRVREYSVSKCPKWLDRRIVQKKTVKAKKPQSPHSHPNGKSNQRTASVGYQNYIQFHRDRFLQTHSTLKHGLAIGSASNHSLSLSFSHTCARILIRVLLVHHRHIDHLMPPWIVLCTPVSFVQANAFRSKRRRRVGTVHYHHQPSNVIKEQKDNEKDKKLEIAVTVKHAHKRVLAHTHRLCVTNRTPLLNCNARTGPLHSNVQ